MTPGFAPEIIAALYPRGGSHVLRMVDGLVIHIHQPFAGLYEAHIRRGTELLSLLAAGTIDAARSRALAAWRIGWD